MTPFKTFIEGCAFLHDDWESDGIAAWGQYDTNPFLLGAPVCVVGTLRGFGTGYEDYLRSLGAFPERVIIPRQISCDLTANLLADQDALAELREVMAERRLNLSLFYSVAKQATLLQEGLSSPSHTPQISPNPSIFERINPKLDGLHYLAKAGIPHPEYAVCTNSEELVRFIRDPERRYARVALKSAHRKIVYLDSSADLNAKAPSIRYPVLAETFYPIRTSPSINAFIYDGKVQPLFATLQYLSEGMNWGNDGPSLIKPALMEQMAAHVTKLGAITGNLEGVIGVDFIHTTDDRLFAVDLNLRFCSPTYPFYLLQRLGFNLEEVHLRYRVIPCRLMNLTQILEDRDFLPLMRDYLPGMFVFDPVVYDNHYPVNYLSYIVVGEDQPSLDWVEARLQQIIQRVSG